MQSTDPFCRHIMKRLLNKTAPKHELKTFFIHNGLLYRYASDHSEDFCTLVIPKAWKYTILVETHDKMGHQGNNRTYSLIKQQYYWKGMAKDVKDYIQRCPACRQEKARVQLYPLHMTEIPNRPFDKIAMDLVMDFTESNKGNKNILTIIDLLTVCPEAIPIMNKSADTITKAFIRHYLPRHMCPWFILSDNGTEFKNQVFDKVTKDLGIERIFSRLLLSIAKKYLDDHRFLTAEKTTDRAEPGFKIGDRVYFKTKPQGNGTSNGEQDTESSGLSMKDVTCTLRTKLQERSDPVTSRTLS